ncbi:hypothetical protein ABZ755_34260 [Streptomyces griseoincarnatus]
MTPAGRLSLSWLVPPPRRAGGVAGDVDADFHHQLGFHQRDDQMLLAAPPG